LQKAVVEAKNFSLERGKAARIECRGEKQSVSNKNPDSLKSFKILGLKNICYRFDDTPFKSTKIMKICILTKRNVRKCVPEPTSGKIRINSNTD